MNKIQELIEAGKKATQGDFTLEKVKPEDGFDECLMTFGGNLKLDNYQYSAWQTIMKNDAEFIAQAANARTEIEQLHTIAQEMAEALEFYLGGDNEGFNVWLNKMEGDCGSKAQQALTKWTEFKK